ncbi:MAG: FAD-dependent oxidoreductase [Acidobacteriota bacterium]|nr:MAG: FAD-dependent oxidoreductase [Acidobacteriota bacterium]
MSNEQVIVLGAGIQGVCVALAVSRLGYAVKLIDRAPDCMLRTSRRNEGKIHLGLVYANDPSMRTPLLMLEAALHFAPLIEEWTGNEIDWGALRSRPFTYAVLRHSLLHPDVLIERYVQIQQAFSERKRDRRLHYLGLRPKELWTHQPGELPNQILRNGDVVEAIPTAEVAINLIALREVLRRSLHRCPSISTFYRHTVDSVRRTAGGFEVATHTADGKESRLGASLVVNCLWTDRLRVDREFGIETDRRRVYRLKYGLWADLPAELNDLPSLTFVLGPFGDIVNDGLGKAYMSWYPSCMRGWSTDLSPPSEWEVAHSGVVPGQIASEIEQLSLEAFDALVPGLRQCRVRKLSGGTIFCWGRTDIEDPKSELHERHAAGISAHDGYYSIDTGKYTCAPLFAHRLAQELKSSIVTA